MKSYIGTKVVNATSMTRADYNTLRGWTLPADEDGADAGYLVEYTNGSKPNHKDFAGYVSWSPEEQFDRAYRETLAEKSIGELIEASSPTAPRITPTALQANISACTYFTGYNGFTTDAGCDMSMADADALKLLTICVLVLQNGFTVTGESACASPENFNIEIGRKIARQNAEQKIWPLMGYSLKEQLIQTPQPPVTSA